MHFKYKLGLYVDSWVRGTGGRRCKAVMQRLFCEICVKERQILVAAPTLKGSGDGDF